MQRLPRAHAAGKHRVMEFVGRWLVVKDHRLVKDFDGEAEAIRYAAYLNGQVPGGSWLDRLDEAVAKAE